MTARRTLPWVVVALVAAGVLINTRLLQPHNRLPCRGNAALPLCSVSGAPVLQLELAWRDDDIVRIFAPTNDDSQLRRNIDDARIGNRFDTLLFVPDYTLLLIALAGVAASLRNGFDRWFALTVALALIAGASDWIENAGITRALDHLAAGAVHTGDARAISNPALVKWSLLPIVLMLIAARFFSVRTFVAGAVGLVTLALAALVSYGLVRYAGERSGTVICSPERQVKTAAPPLSAGCRAP